MSDTGMKVCAITNVYNESFNLPVWIRHYTKQLGGGCCMVVDHGSDDGSTTNIDYNASVIRLPRSPFDDGKRANFITDLARTLLREFDVVLYTDADELLIADPRKFASLREFLARDQRDFYTAYGLNLVHKISVEDPYDASRPILAQRRHVQFVAPMCKTLICRKSIGWTGGFHGSTAPVSFGGLYLLHTRWMDVCQNLTRLHTTRSIEWANEQRTHHKAEYPDTVRKFLNYDTWPVQEDADFHFSNEVAALTAGTEIIHRAYRLPQNVRPEIMFKLPGWFDAAIV
ncbi:hypothetical protein GCM10009416_13700 [Craurococcus roseus]|uniref:Glycosyltransferase family 2 protein n=1 Tax=Craurococcus roseus TaxID=77585 RepID=A0ABN1EWF5_9PROT